MIVYRQKIFDTYMHYTTSDGAKGILKNGFRPGRNTKNAISAYSVDGDDIRAGDHDMNELMKKHIKRNDRINRLNKQPIKYLKSAFKDNSIDFDDFDYETDIKNQFRPTQVDRTRKEFLDAGVPSDEVNKIISTGKRVRGRLSNRGLELMHNPNIPGPHRQLLSIDGLGNGNWNSTERYSSHVSKSDPIYRMNINADNASLGKGSDYNEHLIDPKNIKSTKVEIPKGMDKSHRLRGYIEDFGEIGEENYNMADPNTEKAVQNIKRKKEFFSKGHGSRKTITKSKGGFSFDKLKNFFRFRK